MATIFFFFFFLYMEFVMDRDYSRFIQSTGAIKYQRTNRPTDGPANELTINDGRTDEQTDGFTC